MLHGPAAGTLIRGACVKRLYYLVVMTLGLRGPRRWALPTVSSPPAIWSCSHAIDDGEGKKVPEIAEKRVFR